VVVGCKTYPAIHLSHSISQYWVSGSWDPDEVKTLDRQSPDSAFEYKLWVTARGHIQGGADEKESRQRAESTCIDCKGSAAEPRDTRIDS
jgi:hypothetical protein